MTSPEQWTWFLTAPGVACASGDNDGTIPHSRRQADREPWDAGSGYQLGQASQPGGPSGMIASGTKYSEWCEERQGVRWLDSEMPCRESGVFGPTPSNHARHAKVARVGGPPHEKLSMKKRRKSPSGDRGHGQFQDLRHLPHRVGNHGEHEPRGAYRLDRWKQSNIAVFLLLDVLPE